MARTGAFDRHADRYDQWFVRHDGAYISELSAVRRMVPRHGLGLEIGVGTARFAVPLGVAVGVDASVKVLRKARDRQVIAVAGIAEALPFADQTFDYCLIVTTICFADDVDAMLREACRVLKLYGDIVVGLIDRDSPLGQYYLSKQAESVFYRDATFYSAQDLEALLISAGFQELRWLQTLFKATVEGTAIEEPRPGYGSGSFVVVKATRSADYTKEAS